MDDKALTGPAVEPVARLLELGEPKYSSNLTWPDYQSFGIEPEHIPALIRIATDYDLIRLPDENDPRAWGPIHAWRALGQLHAREAIEPLLRLFHEVRDNDWVIEEMPDVFALIGPAAYPFLADYLKDGSFPPYSRMVAATSLTQLARSHSELRNSCIEALAEQLLDYLHHSPGMNGVLIANLVELGAVEKADLIQKVFTEAKVDRFIVGDWRDVKHRLRNPSSKRAVHPQNGAAKNGSSSSHDSTRSVTNQEPHNMPLDPK